MTAPRMPVLPTKANKTQNVTLLNLVLLTLVLVTSSLSLHGCGGTPSASDASVDTPMDAPLSVRVIEPLAEVDPTNLRQAQVHAAAARDTDGIWFTYCAGRARTNDGGVIDSGVLDSGAGDSGAGDSGTDATLDAGAGEAGVDGGQVPGEDPDASNLKIFLTKVSFTGEILVPAFRVENFPYNQVEPEVRVSGNRVLVSWLLDRGGNFESNLQIGAALFDRDGNTIGQAQIVGTEPNQRNHSTPYIVPTTEGEFVLAGARIPEGGNAWRVFTIPVDGTFIFGEANATPQVTETQVNIVGTYFQNQLGWLFEQGEEEFSSLLYWNPTSGEVTEISAAAASPHIDSDAVGQVAAFIEDDDIRVVRISATGTATNIGIAGRNNRLDHTPQVAMDGRGGGAVVWYRVDEGARSTVHFARFGASGGLSAEYVLERRPVVGIYEPILVHYQGDQFFVGWSEGGGLDLRAVSTLIEVAAP